MTTAYVRDDHELTVPLFEVVTESAAARRMMQQADMLARCDQVPILLEGESGTGKSQLARYIHQLSRRAARPFQIVLLSTLDDSIASSDLFGHVRGAFTDARQSRPGHFVESTGGSLFLDEIGKASRSVQGKLLHAIEYKEITPVGSDRVVRVDSRIIAATNVPLEVLVERGEFLPDLAARFGHFRLRLPALRERRADIPHLVASYVQRHFRDFGYAAAPIVSAELAAVLQEAPWPANLRELDSAVKYLLMTAGRGPVLELRHCTGRLAPLAATSEWRRNASDPKRTRELVLREGGISQAARALGVPRSTIQRRLKRLGEISGEISGDSADQR